MGPRDQHRHLPSRAIRVTTQIPAARAAVWVELEQLEHHVDWMADATAIRFVSEQHRGVGTAFECDTKVGPLRLTDVMEVVRWDNGHAIGVHHRGLITGTGQFTLHDADRGTVLVWEEELTFPWWLGSRFGAFMARPILKALWRGNLRRFADRVVEEQKAT